MLNAASNDPDENVRIAAIDILGQYMMEAEFGERIPVSRKALNETLAGLLENESPAVRRAAVVSYSVSEDERVKGLISGYSEGKDPDDLCPE